MKEKFYEALIRLVDVKSLISFVIVFVFAYLAIQGIIEPDSVMNVVMMVIAFFFGTKVGKKEIK